MISFCDTTFESPAANLAADEALLLEAEGSGPEALRVWELRSYAVVVGAGGLWQTEANVAACQRDGIPVLRRSSGGGTVLLGPGCLCFSLVLGYERHPALADLHASYRLILETLCRALEPFAPGIEPAGTSDLAVGGLKCSGNAQQRKRRHLLHHGTLLYDFDLGRLESYLAAPERQPDYRCGRPHREFVMNLQAPRDQLVQALRQAWSADAAPAMLPVPILERLMAEKYGREDWHHRR